MRRIMETSVVWPPRRDGRAATPVRKPAHKTGGKWRGARRERLGGRGRDRELFVIAPVAVRLRGEHAVEIDFDVLVMVDQQQEPGRVAFGEGESAPNPDVGRLPFGADDRTRGPPGAEAAGGLG